MAEPAACRGTSALVLGRTTPPREKRERVMVETVRGRADLEMCCRLSVAADGQTLLDGAQQLFVLDNPGLHGHSLTTVVVS